MVKNLIGAFSDNQENIPTKHQFELKYNLLNVYSVQYNIIYIAINKFLKSMQFETGNYIREPLPFVLFHFK